MRLRTRYASSRGDAQGIVSNGNERIGLKTHGSAGIGEVHCAVADLRDPGQVRGAFIAVLRRVGNGRASQKYVLRRSRK